MSIQVSKKLNKFKTSLPKKGAFTIETEPDFPKLHTLCIASGKRGGGKSIATANFIKSCKDKHYYDRVWLVTPTGENHTHLNYKGKVCRKHHDKQTVFLPTHFKASQFDEPQCRRRTASCGPASS